MRLGRLIRQEAELIKPLFIKTQSLNLRLTLLIALSLTLIVLDDRAQELRYLRQALSAVVYPLQVAVDLPFSTIGWLNERLVSHQQLSTENIRLRTQAQIMQAQLQKLAALEAENGRLREMLATTEHMSERLSIAEIMRLDLNPYRQRIVINRGSLDKVYVGQPIIDAYGVMGQITEVGPKTAIALLITDANHSLPVEVTRNGLRTIAQGSGKDNLLELPYLPNNADIQAGDVLVTSGLDGRFPRGYPVAKVLKIESGRGEQFASITATPIAHLDRSLEVLLVWRRDATSTASKSTQATAQDAADLDFTP